MKYLIAIAMVALLGAGAWLGIHTVKPLPGAVASPDSPFQYYSVNGLKVYKASVAVKTQSEVLCAIQSPAATSTLNYASLLLTVSSSTATTVDIAQSATAAATTTLLGAQVAVAAGAQASIVASTSPTSGTPIFSPSTYIVFGLEKGAVGGSTTGLVPQGTCEAVFTTLQ